MVETTSETQQAFHLKASIFTFTVLQLINPELESFGAQLDDLLEQAPKFFEQAPIILDLQHLKNPSLALDLPGITQLLRNRGMIPVGLRGGAKKHQATANQMGMAILAISKTEAAKIEAKEKVAQTEESLVEGPHAVDTVQEAIEPTTKIVRRPIRSGQQVYAAGGDLIVIGAVSQGAECLADGNIHIYGPLRGRALAGINGNTDARIFCQSMSAELVAIAGCYIVNESLTHSASEGFKQIYLLDGKLQIETL